MPFWTHIPPATPTKRKSTGDGGKKDDPGYTIVRQIGEGSFYKIYLTTNGTVVRLAKRQAASVARAEEGILQRVASEHVCRVFRSWEDDGLCSFEMEYYPDGDLRMMMDDRKADPSGYDARMDGVFKGVKARDHRATCSAHPQNDKENSGNRAHAEETTKRNKCEADGPFDKHEADDPFDCIDAPYNTSNIYTDDSSSTSSLGAQQPDVVATPKWVDCLMHQMATALAVVHSRGIVHMDIKPANILRHGSRFVLCDFNISRVGEGSVDLDGDSIYMAPEILKNKCFYASDVFSLGLLYLELCNPDKTLPPGGDEYHDLRHNEFRDWKADEIARRMLYRSHRDRCSIEEVRQYFAERVNGT